MQCNIKSVEVTGRTTTYAVELDIQPPDDGPLQRVDCTVQETYDANADYTDYAIVYVEPEKFWPIVGKEIKPQIIEAIIKKEGTDGDTSGCAGG